MKWIRWICSSLALSVLMVGAIGFAQRKQTVPATVVTEEMKTNFRKTAIPARGFTATMLEWTVNPDGGEELRNVRVLDVNEDGFGKETIYSIGKDGPPAVISRTEQGDTMIKGDAYVALNPANPKANDPVYRSHEFYKTLSYNSIETIAGLQAYVFRNPAGDDGSWIEMAHAPETGRFKLRMIYHSPRGGTHMETVRIVFK